MSTKNLARTVIEGGRYHGNCWQRRYTNRLQRPRTREALLRASREREFDDMVIPARTSVRREFRDKPAPAKRWLDRQVGRPWNLVRAELFRTFNTRTTAGRHIVFDHMLRSVVEEAIFPWAATFKVDAHGLLRRLPPRRFPRRRPPEPLPRPEPELTAWLSGRRVAARAETLFWFIPTARGGYRQHHLLGRDDAALWRSLPDWFRACHDLFASAARPAAARVS